MMTSSNGNIFRVTGPLCGEFTGHPVLKRIAFQLSNCPIGFFDISFLHIPLHVIIHSSFSANKTQWQLLVSQHMHQANTWWRHQMETFSASLAICAGNSPVTGEFPHKGQWRGALMFSLICTRINGWVNNGEAGDLRRHRAHYDVTVMIWTGVNLLLTGPLGTVKCE